MTTTLFKNGQPVMHGLKRSTIFQTLQAIKSKSAKPYRMVGTKDYTAVQINNDVYEVWL